MASAEGATLAPEAPLLQTMFMVNVFALQAVDHML